MMVRTSASRKAASPQAQHARGDPLRRGRVVLDKRLQRGVGSRHRAGRRRKSRQRDLSFQDQGRAASRNLPASLRADESQAFGIAGGSQTGAGSAGPAGGDRARLRACRHSPQAAISPAAARALPAARGDVGGRQRGRCAGSSRRPSTIPVTLSSMRSTKACRTSRAPRSSGACHFLLGALYYTLVTPERVSRLSRGEADGTDAANAIEQLVQATVASLQASAARSARAVATAALSQPTNNLAVVVQKFSSFASAPATFGTDCDQKGKP